jgi:SpoVK/Ycf46/Vps4 family AAA+-type ATPase
MMTVEDKPDVTYDDVGGAKDALEKLREVVELPLLHPCVAPSGRRFDARARSSRAPHSPPPPAGSVL